MKEYRVVSILKDRSENTYTTTSKEHFDGFVDWLDACGAEIDSLWVREVSEWEEV